MSDKIQHIAIIMDGNRRWAKEHGQAKIVGHKKGAENLQRVVEAVKDEGVKYLTIYAFSTENWQRSPEEVSSLMGLLRSYLEQEFKEIQKHGVRIKFIGERQMLDSDIVDKMAKVERDTAKNDNLVLNIALSYGSRQEIVSSTKKIAQMVKRGDIVLNDIDQRMFSDMLYTQNIPDPDIVIRTGGDKRISNYLLWQIAYSELFFTSVLWPDFGKEDLKLIVDEYNQRERRYGKS